jgi:hypothetical protein
MTDATDGRREASNIRAEDIKNGSAISVIDLKVCISSTRERETHYGIWSSGGNVQRNSGTRRRNNGRSNTSSAVAKVRRIQDTGRVGIVKIVCIGNLSNAPHAKIALERGSGEEHAIHAHYVGGVPARNILVECITVEEHTLH